MKSHNKSYESMFNQIKATYFSHILQGQASGYHTLISLLNSYKDLQFLVFWGARAHILGPRNLTDWKLHEDLYVRNVINPSLFGVSGVAYFIWKEGERGGGECRTLVFSKLEMVWRWNETWHTLRPSYAKLKSNVNFQNGGLFLMRSAQHSVIPENLLFFDIYYWRHFCK